MKYLDEYRSRELCEKVRKAIRQRATGTITLMEVCGTHTMAMFRHGLRQLLPAGLSMLSGPGCPVCVTPRQDVDRALELARRDDVLLATYGDMMNVPGSSTSLAKLRANGQDIRVVYSTLDVLGLAESHPRKKVVFLAVGFETTAPASAICVLEAEKKKLGNLFLLPCHKTIPAALKALVAAGEVRVDGFMCPGHVSTIIGSRPYEFLAAEYRMPCVIAGFEPVDILQAIQMLAEQVVSNEVSVDIQYSRAVRPEGNPAALAALELVFEAADSNWRGLGVLPGSGLSLRKKFESYDAAKAFAIEIEPAEEPAGCLCGEVLRGVKVPRDCKLFGKTCTPEEPTGPCMVSSEGTCAAYYRYGC